MKQIFKTLTVLFVCAQCALAIGCSLKHEVQPVKAGLIADGPQPIALVRNDAVFLGFHNAITLSLSRGGFVVESVPQGTAFATLPLAMTYTANWTWDFDLYLRYAHIELFKDGVVVGDAVYDAFWGGLHLGKFIETEKKVDRLVCDLFPERAPAKAPR